MKNSGILLNLGAKLIVASILCFKPTLHKHLTQSAPEHISPGSFVKWFMLTWTFNDWVCGYNAWLADVWLWLQLRTLAPWHHRMPCLQWCIKKVPGRCRTAPNLAVKAPFYLVGIWQPSSLRSLWWSTATWLCMKLLLQLLGHDHDCAGVRCFFILKIWTWWHRSKRSCDTLLLQAAKMLLHRCNCKNATCTLQDSTLVPAIACAMTPMYIGLYMMTVQTYRSVYMLNAHMCCTAFCCLKM